MSRLLPMQSRATACIERYRALARFWFLAKVCEYRLFFQFPERTQPSLAVERKEEFSACHRCGRSQGQPHIPRMVENSPRIDHVEATMIFPGQIEHAQALHLSGSSKNSLSRGTGLWVEAYCERFLAALAQSGQ